MNEPQISTNVTIYLLLVVCTLFVAVDGIELYNMIYQWEYAKSQYNINTFDNCIKFPILARTGFTIFSFLAAMSSFIIAFLLTCSVEYFVEKLARAYVYMNYVLFGPYMLGVGILGVFYWDKILFHCEYNLIEKEELKIFSFSNLFNLSACIGLSILITVGMVVYQTLLAYFNSVGQRDEANPILRKLFWWVVLKWQN